MRHFLTYILVCVSIFTFAQNDTKEADLKAAKKANDLVYKANSFLESDDFVSAEMRYREAISEAPSQAVSSYNLGTSFIQEGNTNEALYQLQKTAKLASDKTEKHRAFHNIGNILMANKKCKEAVEAFKNALRNNPTDDESRYNLALAKDCAKQQEDQNQDENKDQDKNEDKQDENKDQDQKDKDQEGNQDKKDGEDQENEDGKPKDDKKDEGKQNPDQGDKKDKQPQQQKPQPGQMSPQQIKNLLEAMNNQEEKVQEKMNAEKQKGAKIQTEKDW